MRYVTVVEKTTNRYPACEPDLTGCLAAAQTVAAVEAETGEATRLHREGLQEDNLPVPPPIGIAEQVEA